MRKYREQGDFGLMEHRGRRKEYKDLEREVKRLRPRSPIFFHPWKKEINSFNIIFIPTLNCPVNFIVV